MPMLSNVFFDLDGTLFDPKEGITRCIRYALEQLGRPCPSELELTQFIGPPLRVTFKKLLCPDEKRLIEEAVSFFRERFSKVGLFENKVYPEIAEMLAVLHENSYRLYVVTSKPKVYAERIVRHFSLDQWFSNVFGPDLDGHLDNKTELIESVLTNFMLVPEETVVIGDRKEDIVAGKLNRTRTIGVTYGYGSEEEILGSAPDYICHRPYEIQTAIMGRSNTESPKT